MITRFAPSPTGPLHLGHAFSALTVQDIADIHGGTTLLRIEDTDSTRCRAEFTTSILEDMGWLGFEWSGPVRYQSHHYAQYFGVLDTLAKSALLYPCSCSRKDIQSSGAKPGWDGLVYPGMCTSRKMADARPGDALRLDIKKALRRIDTKLSFTDVGPNFEGLHVVDPDEILDHIGDPVLRRKEANDPAYHLACTHDDALQGITHIIRGEDVFRQTWLHVLLQNLLGYPTPTYYHHGLIRDETGKRLAKRDGGRAIRTFREEGVSPNSMREMVGLKPR